MSIIFTDHIEQRVQMFFSEIRLLEIQEEDRCIIEHLKKDFGQITKLESERPKLKLREARHQRLVRRNHELEKVVRTLLDLENQKVEPVLRKQIEVGLLKLNGLQERRRSKIEQTLLVSQKLEVQVLEKVNRLQQEVQVVEKVRLGRQLGSQKLKVILLEKVQLDQERKRVVLK